jgi:hypothetical protein
MFGIVLKALSTPEKQQEASLIDRLRCATSTRRLAALAECGRGVPVKWAHLALISLAEPHDEAPCHKIHRLGSYKDRITDHCCVNQEE